MKSLHAHLLTQAAAPNGAHAPCLLVAIAGWGGSTVRWAASDAPVTYGGASYAARPFTLGALALSHEAGQERASFSVANHDLALSALCAASDPTGCAVTFYRVFLGALDHSVSLLTGCEIAGYQLTETECNFALVSGSATAPLRVPARVASRSCQWAYQGTECGYAGAEASCDHSLEACRTRLAGSNLLNYGGIPPAVPLRG